MRTADGLFGGALLYMPLNFGRAEDRPRPLTV
jgi:hypothetical protein